MEQAKAHYTSKEDIQALLDATYAYKQSGGVKVRAPKKKRTRGQRIRRAIANMLYLALVALLAVVLLASVRAKRNNELFSIAGHYIFTVKTGSMVPTLPIGCYIISEKPDDPANIPIGTITTFYFKNGMIVTHRIMDKTTAADGTVQYKTKGDNPSNAPDPEPLTPDRVIAVHRFTITLPKLW